MFNETQSKTSSERSSMIAQLKVMLSGQLVDVELDKISFDTALDLSLEKYRQRSSNSVEESYIFIQTEEAENQFTLPNEVISVRKMFRRNFGLTTGDNQTGQLDPFDIAFSNMYILQEGSLGGLATYDFYAQNIELAARLFGYEYNYTYNSKTKRLTILRNIRAGEEIMVQSYNYIPEESLLQDTYAKPWLRSYALAESKLMLGSAYEKFGALAGPQGGVTLNGSQIKAEATQEKMELEDQIKKYGEGGVPLGIVMG